MSTAASPSSSVKWEEQPRAALSRRLEDIPCKLSENRDDVLVTILTPGPSEMPDNIMGNRCIAGDLNKHRNVPRNVRKEFVHGNTGFDRTDQ